MRKHIFIALLSIFTQVAIAQDLTQNFKLWNITSLNLEVKKRNTFTVSQLSSFDVNPSKFGFGQYGLGYKRELTDHWSVGVGYAFSRINSKTPLTYHRGHINATHRFKFGAFRISNRVQLEQYFPGLQKFAQRGVFTNKLRYYNKKWPLRMSPYIRNQLFYYQGGTEITYWLEEEEIEELRAELEDPDDDVEDFVEQAPNGLHRYRFTAGVRARLAPRLFVSVFYTLQREFNTNLRPYRGLNVPNKSGTKIKRPFNNYSLIGMSLSYTIKIK